MVFKGRTVLAFILVAMFASSIVTITFFNPIVPGNSNINTANQPGSNSSSLTDKDMKKLETTFNLIHSRYVSEIDHDKILNGAITGMIAATGDPFSSYMTPKETKQFQENVDALFEGIGAELITKEGNVLIQFLYKNSPAEKAGLRVNDVITQVNGENIEGLALVDVIGKIHGMKGTQVEISVMRENVKEPISITVVRDQIESKTVKGKMLTKTIGLLEILQFSARTVDEFKAELLSLEKQDMKALVIDVRDDPGGYLYKVVDIATPFIEKGKTIVQVESRDGKRSSTLSALAEPVRSYPIAVLINKGSASASEILAAALQQSAGSKLIGETSFGKGTVQEQFDQELADGSNMKLTIEKWLTPNGTWVHNNGITPDIKVEQPAYFHVFELSKKETLKFDMNNEDVKNMQIMLGGLDYTNVRVDGYFDTKTTEAVKAFQKDNQLAETGEADKVTMNRLEAMIKEKIKDSANDNQLNAAISYLQTTLAAH